MHLFQSLELGRATAWRKLIVLLAAGFGLGLSPVASGTAGALLGLPLMLWLKPFWTGYGVSELPTQISVTLGLTLLAIPLCAVAEKHFGRKDDSRVVADEFLTFPIGLLGLPLGPGVLALAFFTNRVFDVLKPFPAYRAQRLPGGLGIVLDDVVAACYSLLVNHALYYLIR
ncbi:MAG: phosphatidylglycerophosphatase A [Lentisphaerae bacterium]|nr:phosphatidylglycerophosphatase A [Lentisphaerota bacterium]